MKYTGLKALALALSLTTISAKAADAIKIAYLETLIQLKTVIDQTWCTYYAGGPGVMLAAGDAGVRKVKQIYD